MSKTLQEIQSRLHVAHVDDERSIGNSILVTLEDAWCFRNDPGCRVMGFDTVAEARAGTSARAVYKTADGNATAAPGVAPIK